MILSTVNDMDILTVEVETKQVLSESDALQLEKQLINDIKSVIVFTPKIKVLSPNTIPESGIKAKRVIDKRKGK